VIVVFVSFRVPDADRAAFDRWMAPLIEAARAEDGCVVYEYFTDPVDPGRGVMLEAWESAEALDAHSVHPAHVEMVAFGTQRWDMRDLAIHSWGDASAHAFASRPTIDVPAPGREAMMKAVKRLRSGCA
jgi:quinol monooxygenase YgiN